MAPKGSDGSPKIEDVFAGRGLALDPSQPFSSYLRTHFTNADGLTAGVVDDT